MGRKNRPQRLMFSQVRLQCKIRIVALAKTNATCFWITRKGHTAKCVLLFTQYSTSAHCGKCEMSSRYLGRVGDTDETIKFKFNFFKNYY